MPDYKAPLRDMRFLIDHVFDFHSNYAALGATDASPDMIDAILEEGARFCENVLSPLNRSGDEEGCHFNNGEVTTLRTMGVVTPIPVSYTHLTLPTKA